MNLNTYLLDQGKGSAAKLSRQTEIPTALISQYRHGVRKVPATHCVRIENATDKKVPREDLRPVDFHFIWPELAKKQNKEVA